MNGLQLFANRFAIRGVGLQLQILLQILTCGMVPAQFQRHHAAPLVPGSDFRRAQEQQPALALVDNQVQMVNIYSADPNIAANDLVTLEDPEGLFLASNVVPVVSEKVTDEAADVINTVSAALTAEDLVKLNSLSVNDQESAEQIAKDWLSEQNLF